MLTRKMQMKSIDFAATDITNVYHSRKLIFRLFRKIVCVGDGHQRMIWLQVTWKICVTFSATSAESELSRDRMGTFETKRLDSCSNSIPMPMASVTGGCCDKYFDFSIFDFWFLYPEIRLLRMMKRPHIPHNNLQLPTRCLSHRCQHILVNIQRWEYSCQLTVVNI